MLDEKVWGLHFKNTGIGTKKVVNVYHNGNAGQQHTDTVSNILQFAHALYTIEIDNSNDHNVWPMVGKVPTTASFVDTAYMLRKLMVPMVSLGKESVTPHTDTMLRCTLTDIYHALPSIDTVKVPDVMNKLSLIGMDNVMRAQLSAMRDGVTLSHRSRQQDEGHNDNESAGPLAYSMCHHDMRYLHPATDTPAFHSRLLSILSHVLKNNPGCQGFVVLQDHTTRIHQRHILLHYLVAESSCLFKIHTYPNVAQNWLSNGWIILQTKQDWEDQEQKFCRPCVIVAPRLQMVEEYKYGSSAYHPPH